MGILLIAGCTAKPADSAEEAAKKAGLRRDQYSREADGSNSVTSADGTTTTLLPESDLARYGVPVYPESNAKAGNAFKRESARDATVFYTLQTSDKPEKVAEFYEKQLKSKASQANASDYIVSGRLGGNAVVVTILESDGNTRIDVQVIEPK